MKANPKPLSGLSENQLSQEIKTRKNHLYITCIFFGVTCGVALYATVQNGFGWLTFLPIVFFPMMAPVNLKYKEVKNEQERRAEER